MEKPLQITKTEHGYVINRRHEDPCAGCSTLDDVMAFLAQEFGEARQTGLVKMRIGVDLATPVGDRSRAEHYERPSDAGDALAYALAEKMDAVAAPVAEIKTDGEGSGDHQTEAADLAADDVPEAFRSVDALRDELAERMGEARASDEGDAPELEPGEETGGARAEVIAQLTQKQQKVLDVLELEAMEAGDWFQITRGQISNAAGVSADNVPSVIGALEARGLIKVKRQGKGNPVLYRVDLDDGELVDAAE